MRKRRKYILGFVSLLVICGLLIFVKSSMTNDFIKHVEIGHTTYEEVMAADPDAMAVVTSYGYTTFHDLADGKKASIKFVYDEGAFIADSITITSF